MVFAVPALEADTDYVLLAYLPPERANVGEELAVVYMNELFPVTVVLNDSTPIFDPENARIRS